MRWRWDHMASFSGRMLYYLGSLPVLLPEGPCLWAALILVCSGAAKYLVSREAVSSFQGLLQWSIQTMISLGPLTPIVYVALSNVFLYFDLQHASLASQLPCEWLLQSFVIISDSELKKPIKLPIVFWDWRRIIVPAFNSEPYSSTT